MKDLTDNDARHGASYARAKRLNIFVQHHLLGSLRSNDATATRTSLKKVYLRSFSLYRDYSYPITLSNVAEPS